MTAPPGVLGLAAYCGLEVLGWDDQSDNAAVRGGDVDVDYVGSKAEVVAFLVAWQQCMAIKVRRDLVTKQLASNQATISDVHFGVVGIDSVNEVSPREACQMIFRLDYSSFKCERVGIPLDIANSFVVNDIRVGNRSQMLSYDEIPGAAFAIDITGLSMFFTKLLDSGGRSVMKIDIARDARFEFGKPFSMDALMTAMDFTIIVTNVGPTPMRFRAFAAGPYTR